MPTYSYFCGEHDQAKINYSQLLGEGLIVNYPTDGTEDDERFGPSGTNLFIANRVEFEPNASLDVDKTRYNAYYTMDMANFTYEGSIVDFACNDTLYCVRVGIQAPSIDNISLNPGDRNATGTILVEGEPRKLGNTLVISQEQWDSRNFNFGDDFLLDSPFSSASQCSGKGIYDNRTRINVFFDTAVLHEVVGNDIYYQVKANFEGRQPTRILSRTQLPTSIRLAEADEIIEGEIIVPLVKNEERIKVIRYSNSIYFYKTNLSTFQDTFIDSISPFSSDSRNTYTVECLTNDVCPEGTCKVICGDVACCYGSNGIAVESFSLSE